MIGIIITAVWAIGWLVALQPIYKALMRGRLSERRNMSYASDSLSTADAFWNSIVATFGALCWPLAVPFIVSTMMHTGSKPNFNKDCDRIEEEVRADENLRKQLKAARKQIEATSREAWTGTDEYPRDPILDSTYRRFG